MKRVPVVIVILFIFLGAGCGKEFVLEDARIKNALAAAAQALGWPAEIASLLPGEENNFGETATVYGPYQEKIGELDMRRNSLEAIKFQMPAYAAYIYAQDECFKGRGVPFEVLGMTGCCLNDGEKKESRAIMIKDVYIFKSRDYFYATCRAAEYLKIFWKNYH